MKNLWKSLLMSAVVLTAGVMASCEPTPDGQGGYQGTPTIEVNPTSLSVDLAGGTTEEVTVTTPAEWVLQIDTEGVTASQESGNGDAVVTFTVPEAASMRTIKVTFTATGYVLTYPVTKKASLTIVQSDGDIPAPADEYIYKENCGETVSKVDGYWPYVDKYEGWAPQGGEGLDQSGVTYTGKNASVRNSGKSWAPVGASYATDAPYAYINKVDAYFQINDIKVKSGVKNYIFSFTAFNQYASLIASPYTPVPMTLEAGKDVTLYVGLDGENWAPVTFTTMADGNWTYVVAPFTLPQDADKIYVRFADYKANTTTALPSSDYQYQGALRLDDFVLSEGGDGPVLEIGAGGGGGETVEATIADILTGGEGNYTLKNAWVVATYANGFLATDASGKYILCYQGKDANTPAVGTVVEVSGAVTTYGGLLQFGAEAVVTATEEKKSVEYGAPAVLSGSDLDAYVSAPEVKYAQFEGVLAISGNYYNVTIEGASTAVGSISYPNADMAAKLKDLNGKGIKATGFMIGATSSKYTNMMITAVEATGENPEQPDAIAGTKVEKASSLVAGKYIMAGYATEYKDNQGNVTDYSANPYHLWTGKIATSSANTDLETAMYSFSNGALVPGAAVLAAPAIVTLEEVAGKTGTFYVKVGDQYLINTASGTNRRVALGTDKVEWAASDFEQGGIVLSADGVNLGTGKAKSSLLRSYKDATFATSLQYGIVFFATDGTVVPDPTPDPEPDPTPGEVKTIAEILALGSGATISNATIEGVVISNMELNNLTSKKGLYVQDATGGLQFYLAANHELAFGTKVKIDLSGAKLAEYNDAIQISGLALDKITTVSTGNTVEPKTVSIEDFLANKYEAQYVAIEGVQVADADLSKSWVMDGAHTSINMEDAKGNKFVVFSSKYATYGAEVVAQGSGTIKGIASISKGVVQILFAQASDFVGLTGNRFGGATPEPDPTPGGVKTIAEVLALGVGATVADTTTIEGVVISNMELNNLTSKKGLYVQDATGGLQFYLAANHELAFGTKVKIDLSGAKIAEYNGAIQISGLALDKITTVSTGNTVEPKTVSIADFLANKYEAQYVAIEGVQVADADLSKSWVMGGAHTSINVEDAAGNKFVVFSSKYATYGAETVAQGSGAIKGIASISKGAIQLIFAQASDFAGLTGNRFGGGTTPDPTPTPGEAKSLPYSETFAKGQGEWTINNVELGSLSYVWNAASYNTDFYMKASGYKGGPVAAESWLISPAISLAGATAPEFSFVHTHKFAGDPTKELTAWVSADNGANWEQLTIPTYGSNSDYTFVPSGAISLSKYVGKTVNVAFKYVSTSSAAGTWEVKDVLVAEAGSSVTPDPEPEPDPTPGDGTTATIVFNQQGYTNAQSVDGKEIKVDDNVTIVFKKGSASTAPAYYDASNGIRMYQNGATLDVTANGKTITAIEFTFDYQQWYIGADSGTLSAEGDVRTWTGEATAVKFTSTGTDKSHRAYVKQLKVTYK